jgi:hypothetical protein
MLLNEEGMAKICEKCHRRTPSVKDRFCQSHARQLLKEMAESGYLEPRVEASRPSVQARRASSMGRYEMNS